MDSSVALLTMIRSPALKLSGLSPSILPVKTGINLTDASPKSVVVS